MCPSRLQTLLAELLHTLGSLLQMQRPLLTSLLKCAAMFFNPLQQVIQSQGQHPQVGDGHSSWLWEGGGTTWKGGTGRLLPESHQENWQLQETSAAHVEEYVGVQKAASSLRFTVRAVNWIRIGLRGALVVYWGESLVGGARWEV